VDEEVQSGTSHGAANGAAAGASKIRDAILEKPRSSSVYDYSDPPGPRSVHNYMEQVWNPDFKLAQNQTAGVVS
jgi:hypothetical protein